MNENTVKEITHKSEVTSDYAAVLKILETLKMAVMEFQSKEDFEDTCIHGFRRSAWVLTLIDTLDFLIKAMEEMNKKTEEVEK